jgi:ribosomal protein S27E
VAINDIKSVAINDIKSYIKCPNCGDVAEVNMSGVLTSYPPQYHWDCSHCHSSGSIFCDEVKTIDPVIFKKTGARYATRCNVCGSEILVYGDAENVTICKECREAIIAMRKTLGTWNE